MKKAPAYQMYAKDWLSDPSVSLMTAAAEGAYIRLLNVSWVSTPMCTLPVDCEKVRRLTKATIEEWESVWLEIEPHFPVVRGYRRNARLCKQMRMQKSFFRRQQVRGAAGAKARWDNQLHGASISPPLLKNGSASAFASASVKIKTPKPGADAPPHTPRRFQGKTGKALVMERIAEHFDHRKEEEDRRNKQAEHERKVREQAAEILRHA